MSYAMNSRPDTWPGVEGEAFTQAAERYAQSDEIVADALDWLVDHAHEHAKLVELAVDYYRDSPQFDTAVTDIMDGAR